MEPLRGSLSLGQSDLEPGTQFQSLVAVDVGDDEAAPAAESYASPDELRKTALDRMRTPAGQGASCASITAPNAIGSVRSCIVSKTISLGKRFRDLKYIFEFRMAVSCGRPSHFRAR